MSKCSTKSPNKNLKHELAAEFSSSGCEDLEGLVVGDHEPLYQEETSPPFECENCKKQFNTMTSLSSHSKSCSDNDEQSCKLCNKQFANKRNLRDHNRIFHESAEAILSKYSLSCPECDKIFYKKSNLTSHMLRHSRYLLDAVFSGNILTLLCLQRETIHLWCGRLWQEIQKGEDSGEAFSTDPSRD